MLGSNTGPFYFKIRIQCHLFFFFLCTLFFFFALLDIYTSSIAVHLYTSNKKVDIINSFIHIFIEPGTAQNFGETAHEQSRLSSKYQLHSNRGRWSVNKFLGNTSVCAMQEKKSRKGENCLGCFS